MKITPMVRNNICLNAHPEGCAREVGILADRAGTFYGVQSVSPHGLSRRPNHVLIIGCSAGYGLASRLVAGFGYHAATVGISFEREPSGNRTGTPGWYANRAFDTLSAQSGIQSVTFEVDAFSDNAKEQAIKAAKSQGGPYDLIVYSLASPVRTDPESGIMYRSAIKPIGSPYSGTTVDVFSGAMKEAQIQPADEEEIFQTVKVMGGEDWARWMDALESANSVAESAMTVAYSYIGPSLSWPLYRDGTIGRAKADLEAKSREIGHKYASAGLKAYVSINKAVVTRSSAVIPVIPLYVSTLFKVMKERNLHEDCLDQMMRLYTERLYIPDNVQVPLDDEGRIRLDDRELSQSVQDEVTSRMARIDDGNLRELADIDGFRQDFLRAHGFEVPGVDYEAEI
ncbi:MAG: trans-2-enoyl-CoA reductase family protein [Spirochaetaceae bacterium]|nr:trans-2-enoyl-CoA reductase family protein [Spirochaetaceae bacterium]